MTCEISEDFAETPQSGEGDYDWLLHLPRTAWAWEWLRRNADYRAEWERRRTRGALASLLKPDSRWPLVRLRRPGARRTNGDGVLAARGVPRSAAPGGQHRLHQSRS